MCYPLFVQIYGPSAVPDVNKDWTHGAVHSHTLTLQSSSCLTFSLSQLPHLFFFFSYCSPHPPSTSIFDFHPAICTTTTAWHSNHTHSLWICAADPASLLEPWLSLCLFLWTDQTSRESLKCLRVEWALSWICPILCDDKEELSFARQSSCLQLSVKVLLSRAEALLFPWSWETRPQPSTDSLSEGAVHHLLAASRMISN